MNRLANLLITFEPRTLWFGVGRTVIAVAQLSVVLFTSTDALMQTLVGIGPGPQCAGIKAMTLYCIGGDAVGLGARRWIIVAILVLVATGYRPRYTVWLHAWVCLSIGMSISLPDGGEQVARIVGLLLIPVGVADNRRWHWTAPTRPSSGLLTAAAFAALWAIRIQIAVIYLDAGISKFQTADWVNGSAEYYFVRGTMFGASGTIFDILHWMTTIPVFVALLTWGAIGIEIAIGILILGPRRSREVALGLDIVLHGTIILTMGLWSFSLVMIGTAIVAAAPHRPESAPDSVLWRRLLGYVGVPFKRPSGDLVGASRDGGPIGTLATTKTNF